MANLKKRRLNRKYMRRRLMLVVVMLALCVSAGIYIGAKAVNLTGRVEPSSAAEQPSEPVSAPAPEGEPPSSSTAPEPPPPPKPAVDLSAWNLLLVNPREALPEGFSVELEPIVGSFKVDSRIAEPVKRMIAKAKEEGISLEICSAYRSVEYQTDLYENSISQYMGAGKTREEAEALTQKYYAIPGHSEHHTGLALDIVTPEYTLLDEGYADTPAAKWLLENAAGFGFILRYPKDKTEITKIAFEPWHYRYVGEEAAAEIMSHKLCLEEYIYLKQLEAEAAAKAASEAVPSSSQASSGA